MNKEETKEQKKVFEYYLDGLEEIRNVNDIRIDYKDINQLLHLAI